MTEFLANTPEPPYYAVIFSNVRTDGDKGYSAMAQKMEKLASQQSGYLGIESVRDNQGQSITVSYWSSKEAIRGWRENSAHQVAQEAGKKTWYQDFRLRVAKVERAYGMSR